MYKKAPKLFVGFYILLFIWWGFIYFRGLVDTNINFLFGFAFALIPFFGGIVGISNSKNWGLLNSLVGKSIFLFSIGLITWAVGNFIFAYYNLFLKIPAPYPSLADLAYVVSWPLWIIGVVNLGKVIGARFEFQTIKRKLLLIPSSLAIIVFSYYFLIILARQGGDVSGSMLKMFFDVAYPAGDILILTIVLIIYSLSRSYLGGYYKKPVLIILLGFIVNYFADFSFSYTTTRGTFFVASWVDLIFATAMFLLTLGISLFDPQAISSEKEKLA